MIIDQGQPAIWNFTCASKACLPRWLKTQWRNNNTESTHGSPVHSCNGLSSNDSIVPRASNHLNVLSQSHSFNANTPDALSPPVISIYSQGGRCNLWIIDSPPIMAGNPTTGPPSKTLQPQRKEKSRLLGVLWTNRMVLGKRTALVTKHDR